MRRDNSECGSRPNAVASLRQSLPPIPGNRKISALERCAKSATVSKPCWLSMNTAVGLSLRSESDIGAFSICARSEISEQLAICKSAPFLVDLPQLLIAYVIDGCEFHAVFYRPIAIPLDTNSQITQFSAS
ncbi:hypothetical protein XAUC_38190 [Xanthomonas citri pv. aurantifolii str. ICPB 10535]|nr:hypothetical protein XAUC_38190 [Xanthomonas citri pv. aurantifolii str. ICPB 10535]